MRGRGVGRTSDRRGCRRRCARGGFENGCRRPRGRRCSCTPWPGRSGRRRHRAFWLRTLRASGGGFSFVLSWWRLVLYVWQGKDEKKKLKVESQKLKSEKKINWMGLRFVVRRA